ncbi:MAG: VTT domain-containing protein [Rickettsiales bacterium]|nr:VTT domain-containing protein [Rickettsiales bacterium]
MKLQNYLLSKSDTRAMVWIVGILTVFESIFLFIPPEVFMTPPIVANKRRAVPVVAAASIGSVIGGAISYAIGVWLFDSVGMWLINNVASVAQFEHAQYLFDKYGILIIFITAFTPVPYKLMSICAGFIGYNPIVFLGVSAIFRTGRFAIVGYLLWKFQERANAIAQKYFWPLTLGAIAAAFVGIGLMTLL